MRKNFLKDRMGGTVWHLEMRLVFFLVFRDMFCLVV